MPILLKELLFTEDFKSQTKKFVDSGVHEKIVKHYMDAFRKIKDAKYKVAKDDEIAGLEVKKGNDRFDIDQYNSFEQLEMFVDYVSGQISGLSNKGNTFDDIEVDGTPIVKNNGLEIYFAINKRACIKYKGKAPYSWCVSRSDSSNMYNTYRYKEHEPSFYFVKDIDATKKEFEHPFSGKFKDPWHFFVVQKVNSEKSKFDYIVTSANNDGDNKMKWDDILRVCPKLKGMEEYFKHVPLSPDEKKFYDKFKDGVPDKDFKNLSYEEKEAFLDIAIPNYEMTDIKFFALPDDLKNKYIGFGVGVTAAQYEYIKTNRDLYKRFYQITLRKYEASKNDPQGEFYSMTDGECLVLIYSPNASQLFSNSHDSTIARVIEVDPDFDHALKLVGPIIKSRNRSSLLKQVLKNVSGQNLLKLRDYIGIENLKNHDISFTNLGHSEHYSDILKNLSFMLELNGKLSPRDVQTALIYSTYDHDTRDKLINDLLDMYELGEIDKKYGEAGAVLLTAALIRRPERFNELVKIFPIENFKSINLEAFVKMVTNSKDGSIFPQYANLIGLNNLLVMLGVYNILKLMETSNVTKLMNIINTIGKNQIRYIINKELSGNRKSYGGSVYGMNTPFRLANKTTLPILVDTFGIDLITDAEKNGNLAISLISNCKGIMRGNENETDYDLKFLGDTMGKNFFRTIKGFDFGSMLLKIKSYGEDGSVDNVLNFMWWAVKDNLIVADDDSDVVIFLKFTSNMDFYADQLKSYIPAIDSHSLYSILMFQSGEPYADKQNTEGLEKITQYFGTNINKIDEPKLVLLIEHNAYRSIRFLQIVATNIESPSAFLIYKLISGASNFPDGNKLENMNFVIRALGEKIFNIRDDDIGYMLKHWMDRDIKYKALVLALGKERVMKAVREKIPDAAAELEIITEHLIYKNYFNF